MTYNSSTDRLQEGHAFRECWPPRLAVNLEMAVFWRSAIRLKDELRRSWTKRKFCKRISTSWKVRKVLSSFCKEESGFRGFGLWALLHEGWSEVKPTVCWLFFCLPPTCFLIPSQHLTAFALLSLCFSNPASPQVHLSRTLHDVEDNAEIDL